MHFASPAAHSRTISISQAFCLLLLVEKKASVSLLQVAPFIPLITSASY